MTPEEERRCIVFERHTMIGNLRVILPIVPESLAVCRRLKNQNE